MSVILRNARILSAPPSAAAVALMACAAVCPGTTEAPAVAGCCPRATTAASAAIAATPSSVRGLEIEIDTELHEPRIENRNGLTEDCKAGVFGEHSVGVERVEEIEIERHAGARHAY